MDGWLTLDVGADIEAPVLEVVTRDLMTKTAAFEADKLEEVTSLAIGRDIGLVLPSLRQIHSGLSIAADGYLDAQELKAVGGSITLRENTRLVAPYLTRIGGFYDADPSATLLAPAFTA